MNYHVSTGLKVRIITILVLVGMAAVGIVLRAVQLQVLESEKLKNLARRQHKHTIELKARRGDILDQRGDPLAVSENKAQVYVHPDQVNDPEQAAGKIAKILGQDPAGLRQKLTERESFVWLARDASLEQAEAIKVLNLPGIGILPASRRFYPGGVLAANLIGFTGVDGKGLEGLEYKYEDLLAGSPIRIWQERDGRGNSIFFSDQPGVDLGGLALAEHQSQYWEIKAKGASPPPIPGGKRARQRHRSLRSQGRMHCSHGTRDRPRPGHGLPAHF